LIKIFKVFSFSQVQNFQQQKFILKLEILSCPFFPHSV